MKTKQLRKSNQKIKSFFNRAFLIFFGIISSLVLLEVSLRLSATVYRFIRSHAKVTIHSQDMPESDSVVILCLGDSYTYGLGTSFEYSYPRQLEKILNVRRVKKDIFVENLGSPGGNSYRILKIFTENINKYNPSLAIVMVGVNNDWNLEGEQRFYQSGMLRKIKLDIRDLRIYKLWRILTMSLKNKMKKVSQEKLNTNNQSAHPKILTYKKESVNTVPQVQIPVLEWQMHKKKVDSFRGARRSDLAIEEINNMLKKYPDADALNSESVLFLRETGNWDLALEYAKKVLEHESSDSQSNAYIHQELVYIYRAKKEWKLARQEINYAVEDLTFIQNVFPELKVICHNRESGLDFHKEVESLRELVNTIHGEKGTQILDALVFLEKNQEAKSRIFELDLLELINLAKEKNVKLIFMTYPVPLSPNNSIKKIATKYKITLIDNELIFKEKPNKEELLNLDGHCNVKGYGLIASNIYSTLCKMGILSQERIGQ